MLELRNKVALVTGGTSGIGAETARVLAQAGAQVVVAGRREDAAQSVCDEITAAGGLADYVIGEVTDPAFASQAVFETEEKFGSLNILANVAGAIVRGDAVATSDDDWELMISVNVSGTFFMSRAAIPAMRRAGGGSIVNLGSDRR